MPQNHWVYYLSLMGFSEYTELSKPFGQMRIKFTLLFIISFFIIQCKSGKETSHQEGELTIYADPSNQSLLEALTDIYEMKYPKVKFNFVYQSENEILKALQDTVTKAAFINQPLSEQQTKYIAQKSDITPRSTLLAYDAVIFITSIENPIESISLDQIKNGILEGKNQFIFDDGNSGNFNTVKDVLELEIPEGKSIQAEENIDQLIEFLQKSPSSIGIIGLNEISEKDNPRVKEILSKVKTLSVLDEKGIAQAPSVSNILASNYPFSKGVYFILSESGFGIGNGFSRFAGSNQGQLIVKREGLQPNFLYDREVQINLENVE